MLVQSASIFVSEMKLQANAIHNNRYEKVGSPGSCLELWYTVYYRNVVNFSERLQNRRTLNP